MDHHKGLIIALCVATIAAASVSCRHRAKYIDPTTDQTLTTDFSASDLQKITAAMVESLLTFPPMITVSQERKPVIAVTKVKNKTMQHIDTESLTDSIRSKLIKSTMFRFIDRTTDDAAVEELMIQQESGLVDPAKAIAFGQQFGAEYLLTTNISQIQQKAGRVKDVYYKVTMSLKNLRSGILEWSDEKEVRKVQKKPLIGG